MILILLFFSACFLAYSNGANDNFKGVATLFGSGTTNYKKAINWATITTFSGSVAAIFLANELVKNFSGKGLVPNELITMPIFAISIAFGGQDHLPQLAVFLWSQPYYAALSSTETCSAISFASGSIRVNRLPAPSLLSTSKRPFMAIASCCAS